MKFAAGAAISRRTIYGFILVWGLLPKSIWSRCAGRLGRLKLLKTSQPTRSTQLSKGRELRTLHPSVMSGRADRTGEIKILTTGDTEVTEAFSLRSPVSSVVVKGLFTSRRAASGR